ncbi:MAG: type II secretion system protein [Candidatus Wallbacteria bacterium]|nr:type II secretion system protein [Candidatus Wallbacteria bacterium]
MTLPSHRGLTLVEIAISAALMGILATALVPLSQVASRRRAELELRQALRAVRNAIDRYAEDRSKRETSRTRLELYPRDLDELVRSRYLRRVPRDPMTGQPDWRVIGTGDPPDPQDLSIGSTQAPDEDTRLPVVQPRAGGPTSSQGGRGNLLDIRSTANGTALDGTAYKDW